MFDRCTSIQSLDLSSFNTKKAVYMRQMFNSMSSLTSIKFGSEFIIPSGTYSGHYSDNVFPTPTITASGAASTGEWGLDSETADKAYSATELNEYGKTAQSLTGTWYAQRAANLTFQSWNTEPDGSGTTYMPGDTLPDANIDLYAQWG